MEPKEGSLGSEIQPVGLGGKDVPALPRLTPDLLLELIGLVGGKKPALLIPADSSEPLTETEFDQDKLWQYDIATYDRDKVVLTKRTLSWTMSSLIRSPASMSWNVRLRQKI